MADVAAAISGSALSRPVGYFPAHAATSVVTAGGGLVMVAILIAGSVAALGTPALGPVALFAIASALAVIGLALLAPRASVAARPVAAPSVADAGFLTGKVEVSRHLDTVLDALLDLRFDNAHLREAITRSMTAAQRANRLASVGVLTAGIAHEMRNPLVALRAFAQLLPDRWEDGEFRREFSDVVLSEIDRLGKVMSEILSFARHQSASLEETTIGAVMSGPIPLLRAHAAEKQVELELADNAAAFRITANVAQLRQVVMNLALNALEATPQGGRIRIVSEVDATEPATARLRVVDSGAGIEAEHAARIFDPFFTTRVDGTGLGLPISREIVERHGGSLVVESVPGAGATFTVALPASAIPIAG